MKRSVQQEVRQSRSWKGNQGRSRRAGGNTSAADATTKATAVAARAAATATATAAAKAMAPRQRLAPAVGATPAMAEGAGAGMIGDSGAHGVAEPVFTEGNPAAVPAAGGLPGAQAGPAQWNVPGNRPENLFTRIGGMEGIMTGMTNVQKLYGMYKQIQPMMKWLGGIGGGGGIGATAAIQSLGKGASRHRSGRTAGKRSASGAGKSGSAGKKRR